MFLVNDGGSSWTGSDWVTLIGILVGVLMTVGGGAVGLAKWRYTQSNKMLDKVVALIKDTRAEERKSCEAQVANLVTAFGVQVKEAYQRTIESNDRNTRAVESLEKTIRDQNKRR